MSSHKRPAEEEPDIKNAKLKEYNEMLGDANKTFEYDNSDFTVISSDGLRFKVHRWALNLSSPVFRDLVTNAIKEGHDVIYLNDQKLEHSTVLNLYFILVYAPTTFDPSKHFTIQLDPMPTLIEMFKKYKVTRPIKFLEISLMSWAGRKNTNILNAFIFGSLLNNVKICKAAITSSIDQYWDEMPGADYSRRHYLDLTITPVIYLREIPENYKWALIKASIKVSQGGESIWHKQSFLNPAEWLKKKVEVAKRFEQYLGEMDT